MKRLHLLTWALALVIAATPLIVSDVVARSGEPDVVVVQHILIGFKKSVPGKPIERTKKEAKALAEELLQRAMDGDDFDAMVKEYTNDRHPGIYKISNHDAPLLPDARQRKEMVSAFGEVAFDLEIDEVGMAKYNSMTCPYGWHIIKRLE
jgi:hypothetical protein